MNPNKPARKPPGAWGTLRGRAGGATMKSSATVAGKDTKSEENARPLGEIG
jgi:hypothetical protein